VFSAVAGVTSGAVCTQIYNNHRIRRFSEKHPNYVKLLGIMCGCASGGISVCFVGPVGLSATLLRGIQGGVGVPLFWNLHKKILY